MSYAIIGSGAIGTAISRSFARNNVPVMVANKTGKASISALADELGALLTSFGFEVVDLGRADSGGLLQQFGGPLVTRSFFSQAQGGPTRWRWT